MFSLPGLKTENLKIAEVYKNDLYAICDILQLAHHGYGDGANGNIFGPEFNQKFFAPGIDNHVAGEFTLILWALPRLYPWRL